MGKRIISCMVFLLIFFQLVGCKEMDGINDDSIPTQGPNNSVTSDSVDIMSGDTISTNEKGNGIVEYTVIDTQIERSWSNFGIGDDEVTNSGKVIDSSSSIVMLTVAVKNVDVIKEKNESNINCLLLINNDEIITPNPDGPASGLELSYFDNAPEGSLESGRTDYTHYFLPDIGLSKEIKIGFVVPTELIEKNGLSLMHTFMGLEEATVLPLNLT